MEGVLLAIGVVFGMVLGVTIGIFVGMERMRKAVEEQSVGNLRIDRSEPDEPARPFLEIKNATIESISQKKFVILKILNENYISHD